MDSKVKEVLLLKLVKFQAKRDDLVTPFRSPEGTELLSLFFAVTADVFASPSQHALT